jgi:C1A family cysteine protease
MKSFFAALLAASATATLKSKYMTYVIEHTKGYHTVNEFQLHEDLFVESEKIINEHNMGNASFLLGHNVLSDMTQEQKAKMRGRLPRREEKLRNVVMLDETNVPATIDWRQKGAVNKIQDQGSCGSCWAFSSVASLEGAHWLATGKLEKFSEQQLVDCAYISYGNYGCNGGLEDNAFKYYETNDAMLESTYPYTARKGACQYDASKATNVEVSKYLDVASENVSQLKAAVGQQVTSIAIEADQAVFQLYSTGIFDSAKCGTNLDHAVALVGYGDNYWILRNSWGTSWGEQGYMRVAMQDGAGVCGLNMEPVYPTAN